MILEYKDRLTDVDSTSTTREGTQPGQVRKWAALPLARCEVYPLGGCVRRWATQPASSSLL